MRRSYGVVNTIDGYYILATVSLKKSGRWKRFSIKKWENQSGWHRTLLLHRGVYYGITSWWRPANGLVTKDSTVPLRFDDVTKLNLPLQNQAYEVDMAVHSSALYQNLLGIVADDQFLAMVPFYTGGVSNNSFIALYRHEDVCIMGIVWERSVQFSVRIPGSNEEDIAGHFDRISRYWAVNEKENRLPEQWYVMGDDCTKMDFFKEKAVQYIDGTAWEEPVIKAVGVAASGFEKKTARFTGPTGSVRFRYLRTYIYITAVSLVVLSLSLLLAVGGAQWYFNFYKDKYNREYQILVRNNQNIRNLLDTSNIVAGRILQLEKIFANQTEWTAFLEILGRIRPENLFFDRFGSEPVPKNDRVIRVALSGWASQESSVTELVSRLQSVKSVSQVSMTGLERSPRDSTLFQFRIVCTLAFKKF